jgi:hypothetical protein
LPVIVRVKRQRASRRFIELFSTAKTRNRNIQIARAAREFFDW